MNVVYSFIGKMPAYIISSVRQLRLFYPDTIYVIYDNMTDDIKEELSKYDVKFVHYDIVKSERFFERERKAGFEAVPRLGDRTHLFKRSYERFYLLHNLMIQYDLKNIWFLELDIMMYMNPNDFLPMLEGRHMAYAMHRPLSCNSGIFFVRDTVSLDNLLISFDTYLKKSSTEMGVLWDHYVRNKDIVMFPLCVTPAPKEIVDFWKDNALFGDILFDGAILGILYFGFDKQHVLAKGKVIPQIHCLANVQAKFLNIWKYGDLMWEMKDGLSLPYFLTKDGRKYRVANLHIHSKQLETASSLIGDHTVV